MANLAQIQSIAQGQFFVKDSLGNLTELKVGDTVSLNDTIVAANSNTDLSKIEILFDTNELITLSQGEQLLDTTLLASTFGNEELAFDKQEVDETLNAWNNAQDGDETDMETAAGDVTEQATNAGDERAADGGALRSKFNSRDGDATDIVSDLREASWTGGIEGTIQDTENMLLEDPLPVVYTIIEGIDVVNEGDSANYVVKLQDAAGNPVIATQDTIIYVRYTNKTTQDGDTQYNNENIIEVVIKAGTSQTEFTIKTNDDYLADNGEIYNVSITGNNSTEFDMRTGDVAGNKTNVDTTILDNSNPLNPGGEDGGYGSEDIVFAIIEGTTTVNEGNEATYTVKLVDKDGNVVTPTKDTTVTVVYKDKTTNDGLDTNKSNGEKITVVIKANETSAEFKVETKDDYLADNGEVYNVAIEKVEDQGQFEKVNIGDINGDKTNVDTTIIDNSDPKNPGGEDGGYGEEDTVYAVITGTQIIKEGNVSTDYTVKLVDKDGNPVTVTKDTNVTVKFEGTGDKQASLDDIKGFLDSNNSPITISADNKVVVTIPNGKSEINFTVETKDDYIADNNEQYKLTIADVVKTGEFENVQYDGKYPTNSEFTSKVPNATNNVDTTIIDNSDPKNPGGEDGGYGEEDTVYAVITGTQIIKEGNVSTDYTVKLVDKDGNPVTVTKDTNATVKFEGTGDKQASLDDIKGFLDSNNSPITISADNKVVVTIPNGKSEINFTVETKDDYIADNNEQYKLTIADVVKTGEFENVQYDGKYPTNSEFTSKVPNATNNVDTTIIDNTTDKPNQDSTTETNGMEKVILKIVVSDANGVPQTDAHGNYIVENNVNEGADSHYVVLAFLPTSNGVYSTSTKLADNLQGGTVTVSTQNVKDGATGVTEVTSATKIDGSEDYITKSTVEIKVGGGSGNVFSVKTIDDYKAENETNETFKVVIDTNSYKHPNNNVANAKYENVTIDNTGVTTTIVDNSADKNKPVETNPTIDDGTNPTYGQEDTVWAVIEANPTSVIEGNKVTYTVKLVDKNGNAVTVSSETNVTIKFAGGTNPADLADLLKIFGSDGTTEITGFDSTEQKLTIKIPANGSQTQFTIQTKDDFTQEGSETFDLSISKIDSTEFENLVFDKTKTGADNKVTTEIKDGVTLGDPKNAYVDEDNFYKNDFNNTDLSSEYTTKNISNFDNKTGHIKGDLGIIAPIEDNGYTLSFDNTINVYKGNENGTETNIYGDGTALKSGGNEIKYKLVGTDKIVAYTGTEANYDKNKVFEITLEKDNNGKYTGDYKYTQYKNIDHPIDGDDKSINDDDITFEFGFKISDQGSTSSVQTFKVTVNDSTPIAGEQNLVVYEDSSLQFIISDEGFKGNTIEISNDGGNKYKTLTTSSKNGANSIDILENGQKIGTLKNLGSGKLQFIPEPDYSKYSDDNLPNFKYKVSDTDGDYAEGKVNIKVKPVADAPTIFVKNIETTEDNNNTQEGTNKVLLELKVPSLSKDSDATSQTSPTGYTAKQNNNVTKTNPILDGTGDYNGTSTGDSPERNGEITLTFTNSSAVTGAKIFNGVTEVATINSVNQIVKVVIVKTSGGTDIDTDYHHNGTLPAKGGNVLYLTKSEYESLKIQHAEDNDTDIAIKISVTSYEVDDSGKPLTGNLATSSTTTANMTVVIKPVTDDISLKWNVASAGKISDAGKTYTFNDIDEGNPTIDLKALLTKTSGTETFNGSKADLDGSEKRTYIISDIPAGTVIILDGNSYTVQDGKTSIEIPFTSNTKADPTFTMKFPENYSGIVEGKITLSVIDKGNGTEHTNNNGTEKIGADGQGEWGEVKTAEVNFKVNVNPVADDATIKVGQSIGYEDAGRNTDKNVQDKDGTIKHPENGIALDIRVSSTDTDGSEKFELKIKNIPNGGALFIKDPITGKDVLVSFDNDGNPTLEVWNADGTKSAYTDGNIIANKGDVTITPPTSNSVDISGNTNDNQPVIKFIPPHNTHGDFKLGVEAKTVDTAIIDGQEEDTQEVATTKDIVVVVKDVADFVVGNEYKTEELVLADNSEKSYNTVANEDKVINLNSILDATKLASYDSASEDLTIIIKDLPAGITLEGSVTLINGQYIFKASDIANIKIVTPQNYSGELNFKIDYVTTEAGKETKNPSKTFDSKKTTGDSVSIFVKPTVDAEFNSSTTRAEDIEATTIGDKSYYKLDLGISHKNGDSDETLVSAKLDKPADGDFKLFIKNSDGSFSEITDFTKTYTEAELKNIYVQAPENQHGSFDIKGTYTVKDSQYAGKDVNYETKETKGFTHKLTITPVTDAPKLTINVEANTNTVVDGTKVIINNNTASFKVATKTTSDDTDKSEKVVKIVISGVPNGVTVNGITTKTDEDEDAIKLYEHNGVYVIELDKDIDVNGVLENLTFDIKDGNFLDRDITITTYTEDSKNGDIKQDFQTINIVKGYSTGGYEQGIELKTQSYEATEDTKFSLINIFDVSGGKQTGDIKIKVTNGTIEGYIPNADGEYTIKLKGNAADIGTILSQIKVIPDVNFNNNKGQMQLTISGFGLTDKKVDVSVTPVTDKGIITITPVDSTIIDENGEFKFDIKFKNNVDVGTTLKDNAIYIKANETYKDSSETATGKLYYIDNLGNKVELANDGKFEITGDYTINNLPKFVYEAGENRNGDVSITVSTENKEANADSYAKTSVNTTITVIPVVSSEIKVGNVQNGIEDEKMASIELNVVKADPSEKFESVLIKVASGVASGVAVYYDNGTKLAMNLGGGSWLIPVSGDGKTLPEIFFKGKEHLAGNIGFEAIINVKDGDSKVPSKPIKGSVTITEVADGVTIDPTKTGIDKNAFEWTTLNLNANMKDLDGSEKMYLELKGLGENSQFKLKDGGIVKSEYDSVNKVWTIKDIEFDKINDIQFTNDKNATVDIKAWTQDGIDSTREKPATGSMEIKYTDPAIESGKFTLGKEVNIDFSKIESGDIKDVSTIDLGAQGENKLLNLTLQDVLDMGKKDGSGNINLDILGGTDDKVSFAKDNGWELKTENKGKVEGDKTFDVYTNSGDSTVQVKVEQPISDGITN